MNKNIIVRNSIIGIFVGLYVLVSLISTIHVIDFFKLTNPDWLSYTLAIAFELGAAASLAAIIILDKTNRTLVWLLFIILTLVQCMGNMYYAYHNVSDFQSWIELFGLQNRPLIFQKRILSIISGGILPIVSLGFIKSLVDYIRPAVNNPLDEISETFKEEFEDAEIETIEDEDEIIDGEYHEGVEDYHNTPIRESYTEPEISEVIEEESESLTESIDEDPIPVPILNNNI